MFAFNLFGVIITLNKQFYEVKDNVNSKQLIKQIEEDGWYLVAIKGSHHQFKHDKKIGRVTVPHPKKDLPLNTVRSILKQAGLKK
ncbi:type II toxin-antitoxin system HicA family toxin [uncultured Haemophilus sp.]|uniref:type II toxin-antitoxin system HicA family toxin n=1 Tax=uncultured Haemophilus sp. TaxID=237779 RepID=UPI00338FB38C